jgi:rhodanese-related sulfurtransferase
VHVELGEMFASYVGWLVPFGEPMALIVPPEGLEEAVTQLMRIGYEEIRGHLEGGMEAWEADGREAASYRLTDVEDLCRALGSGDRPRVLDVRQDIEHARVSLPGSIHIPIGDLPRRLDEVPRDGEVWAICATGLRSSTAASLLDREGIPVRLVTPAGVRQLMATCPQAAG